MRYFFNLGFDNVNHFQHDVEPEGDEKKDETRRAVEKALGEIAEVLLNALQKLKE